MSDPEETTEGYAEVTDVLEWENNHERLEWRIEVPEGVTRFDLYVLEQPYPVPPLIKGPIRIVSAATVVTGRSGLRKGDKVPVRFWWT